MRLSEGRAIGDTTAGNKCPSIPQFANDTAGLMYALEIKNLLTYLVYLWEN